MSGVLHQTTAASPAPAQEPQASARPRKVLLVAFDFPPRRTSGVYRPTAMTKYLARRGWQTTVLTIAPRPGDPVDASLLRRLPPEVRVVQTPYFDVAAWDNHSTRALQALVQPGAGSAGQANGSNGDPRRSPAYRALRRVVRSIRPFLYLPDDVIGWLPIAAYRVMELHMRERFDALYTTAPPRTAPLVGLACKRLLGLPWVLEFRDPWLHEAEARAKIFDEDVPRLRSAIEQRLYRALLREADGIVTVTEGFARELVERRGVPEEKVTVVSNGYDEDDFRALPAGDGDFFPPGKVHITHFGSVYRRFSGGFFPALIELLRESPELRQRLRLHFIGFPDQEVADFAQRPELAGVVELHGFVPHAEALRAMRSSDGLLIFYADRYVAETSIPGKIYEYLRMGRPVMAVTYEGGLKKIVEGSGAGCILPPEDPQGIKQALRRFVAQLSDASAAPQPSAEFAAQFRYEQLAGRLAAVLGRVAEKEPGHGR